MGALGHAVGSDDVREGRARHGVHLRLGRIGGTAGATGCTGIVGAVRAAEDISKDGRERFGCQADGDPVKSERKYDGGPIKR